MAVTTAGIRAALDRVAARMPTLADELNAADGKLGDGDTGVMLSRVSEKVVEVSKTAPDDLGVAFKAMAMASSASTGSSLGTLLTVSLMTIGKGLVGKTEIDWSEFGTLLDACAKQMLSRGGASLGDKTVVDVVTSVAAALSQLKPGQDGGPVALSTARATLDEFRGKPCRMGRARMFGDKSIGMDDPGMLAFVRIVEAMNG
jgi:dihydroxyacetone kinase-like protein